MSDRAVSAGVSPVRFGFLGAGWVAGLAMAPAVHAADGAVLQAVASRDVERAGRLEPRGRVHTTYEALVADPDVDVVYVNLTNEAHLPWTLAALAAGKHVLCEKPLALTAAQVATMEQAARDADRLLVECLWFQWHPRVRRLAQLVGDGTLGTVRAVEAEFSFIGDFTTAASALNYRLEPDRGGGALYDTGCYCASGVHLVAGTTFDVAVPTGTGTRRHGHARHGSAQDLRVDRCMGATGVDLATAATFTLSGAEVSLRVGMARCRLVEQARQCLRVVGSAGTAELTGPGTHAGAASGDEAFSNWNAPSSLTLTTVDGTTHVEAFAPVDPYRLMVEQVARVVSDQDGWVVPVEHSLAVAATLDAIRSTG